MLRTPSCPERLFLGANRKDSVGYIEVISEALRSSGLVGNPTRSEQSEAKCGDIVATNEMSFAEATLSRKMLYLQS